MKVSKQNSVSLNQSNEGLGIGQELCSSWMRFPGGDLKVSTRP